MRRCARSRAASLVVVCFYLSLGASCPVHPEADARAAQYASEVVLRLGDLQAAAITANTMTPKGLSDQDAILVVRFTVSASRTIKMAPYGWLPTVRAGYEEVKARSGTNPTLIAAFVTIDSLLDAIGSVQ